MRITRVRLSNFKPYGDVDVGIDRGVTVIHGPNGSGKSSLLEACFFALYGSKSLEGTLEGVIRNGTEETEIEVWFTHAGGDYRVERRVRLSGDRAVTATCVLETPEGTVEGARDVRAAVTDLLRMDEEAFLNCAYVRQGEVNKLIDATPGERQAMLDDLLQLGVLEEYRERAGQARLGVEDVLGEARGELDGLEDQIAEKEDRDLHARLNDLETELATVDAEIEEFEANRAEAEETLEAAEEVIETHVERREELAGLEEDIEDLRAAIADTEGEREDLREGISARREELEAKREERDDLLETVDADLDAPGEAGVDADPDTPGGVGAEMGEAESVVAATDRAIGSIDEEDERLREHLKELQIEVNDRTNEADRLRENADDLEAEATEKRDRADDLEAAIADDEETIAKRRGKLEELSERVESKRAAFEDAPVEFGGAERLIEEREAAVADREDDIADLRASLEAVRAGIERAEELLAAGNCPECGQPIEGAPHVEGVEDDRERADDLESRLDEREAERESLETALERARELRETEREVATLEENRSNVSRLLEEKEAVLEEKRERIDALREAAAELDTEAAEKREAAGEAEAAADALRGEIGECNRKRSELAERRERLETLRECVEGIGDLEAEIERLREKRGMLGERNAERRETLREKRERKRDLESEVDDERVARAREEKEKAEAYLGEVAEKLDELTARRDDLQGEIGAVGNELEALESLRERRADLAERVEALESLRTETEEMEALYADLRAELRTRNVESLERLLNETFDLVYENDAYARIELDDAYELTVYQKNGERLDPEQLSGGERALFNLSLRAAIYRLLAEGIEGAAPMPPLVLDEPTVFLDSGHVSQLVDLIDAMRELGVEQIVVVTHDDELVGAAEEVLAVEKDPTTNRSRVEKTDALLA
jgi:exonuclease SbcC